MTQLELEQKHAPMKPITDPAPELDYSAQAVLTSTTGTPMLVRVIPMDGRMSINRTRPYSRSHEYQVAGNPQYTPRVDVDTPDTWKREDSAPSTAGDEAAADDILRHMTAHHRSDPRPMESEIFDRLDPEPPLWDIHAPRITLDVSTPPPPAIRYEEPCGLSVALTMHTYEPITAGKTYPDPTAVELWNGIVDTWKHETSENIEHALRQGNYTLLTELYHGTPMV